MSDNREIITACPNCDDARIRPRNPTHPHSTSADPETWECRSCGSRFDDPVERPRRQDASLGGMPQMLCEAEPEAFPDGGRTGYEQWVGEDCPECGVEITRRALRHNGFAWEHKNPEAHPQAGHHIIQETIAIDTDTGVAGGGA